MDYPIRLMIYGQEMELLKVVDSPTLVSHVQVALPPRQVDAAGEEFEMPEDARFNLAGTVRAEVAGKTGEQDVAAFYIHESAHPTTDCRRITMHVSGDVAYSDDWGVRLGFLHQQFVQLWMGEVPK